MDAFNTEAMKLSAMGVTITVSSGDDGVASEAAFCNAKSGSADEGDWTVGPYCICFIFLAFAWNAVWTVCVFTIPVHCQLICFPFRAF